MNGSRDTSNAAATERLSGWFLLYSVQPSFFSYSKPFQLNLERHSAFRKKKDPGLRMGKLQLCGLFASSVWSAAFGIHGVSGKVARANKALLRSKFEQTMVVSN